MAVVKVYCSREIAFNSIIIASFGFTTRQTVLMSIPVGMISWLGALVLSWVAVKSKFPCRMCMWAFC